MITVVARCGFQDSLHAPLSPPDRNPRAHRRVSSNRRNPPSSRFEAAAAMKLVDARGHDGDLVGPADRQGRRRRTDGPRLNRRCTTRSGGAGELAAARQAHLPDRRPRHRRRAVCADQLRRGGAQQAHPARQAGQVPAGHRLRLPISEGHHPLDPRRGPEEERPPQARGRQGPPLQEHRAREDGDRAERPRLHRPDPRQRPAARPRVLLPLLHRPLPLRGRHLPDRPAARL